MSTKERHSCVNLRELFRERYRVRYEESYYAERGHGGRLPDPWLMLIPCQVGHIYPHGGNLLAVSTDRRGPVAKRLQALPFVEVIQDGDDGINATFPVEHFHVVAEIVKPRRRRVLSREHRAKLVAAGTASLERYRQANTQCDPDELGHVPTHQDDREYLLASPRES